MNSGTSGTKLRKMCRTACPARYGEKANSRPPAKAAGHHEVYRRRTPNIDAPEAARPSLSSRLNAATGPASSVMGMPRTPSSGMAVSIARFAPLGALRYCVKNGLSPCVSACDVQARNHVCCSGSPHAQPGRCPVPSGVVGQ